MTLAEKILKLRTARNLSQGDLAEALEVSRQSVSKWETGQSVPDLDKIIKLADLFGVSVDELVREEIPPHDVSAERTNWNIEFSFPWMAQEGIWKSISGLFVALGFLCVLYGQLVLGIAIFVAAMVFLVLPEKYWLVAVWLSVSVGLIVDVPNGGWISIVLLIALCLAVYNQSCKKKDG